MILRRQTALKRKAGQGQDAPERMGSDDTEKAGGHQASMAGFEQIGKNPGDEDKHKRNREQSKAEAGIVGTKNGDEQEDDPNKQRGGGTEIAGARPEEVG